MFTFQRLNSDPNGNLLDKRLCIQTVTENFVLYTALIVYKVCILCLDVQKVTQL